MPDVQALMQRVDQAIQAGDYETAEQSLSEILREDPESIDARHGMALTAYHRRDFDAAQGWIDAAIALAPANAVLFSTRGSILVARDRLDEAGDCFETVAKLDPGAVDALCNLGVVREKQGRLDDAAAVYRIALERRPDYAIAAFNLGVVLQELGQIDAAAGAYQQALTIAPEMADAVFNLGTLHERQGMLDQAFAEYERAVVIRPNFPAAFYNMGVVRERQGRAEEAAAFYQRARRDPALAASASFNLGCLRRGQARNEEAEAAFHDALTAAPGWAEARVHLERLRLIALGASPYERLADDKMIEAYRYAIRAAVTAESSVLVLDSGLGLVPMMAAQAGARSVVACEPNAALAAAARDIITANGFAGRIHLVAKPSRLLLLGHDLPEPADIVIFGWIPEDPLSDELAEQLDHVRSALLAPGGLVMPSSITMHAALIEAPEIRSRFPARLVHGFDLSILNGNRASLVEPVDLSQLRHRALSQPVAIASLALDQKLPVPSSDKVRITATASGTVHGVVSWFDLDLVRGITLSSGELRPHNAWRQTAHFLPLDMPVEAGDKLLLTVSHGRHAISFPGVEHAEGRASGTRS